VLLSDTLNRLEEFLQLFLTHLCRPNLRKLVYAIDRMRQGNAPDDKVLATLISRDRQPEASGEEAAFDIHGDAFSGRIAFNTYSSSSLLSGGKCHRRPEKVLIRLIEADGTEKDRTLLIMARDFNYEKEQGDFNPKSDATLHG